MPVFSRHGEPEFRLNVVGDNREILDIVRKISDGKRDEFIASRDPLNEDDLDTVSASFVVDDLDELAMMLAAFNEKCLEVALWATARNDEAQASIGFVKDCYIKPQQRIVVETLESRLKDKAGKLAEAALRSEEQTS